MSLIQKSSQIKKSKKNLYQSEMDNFFKDEKDFISTNDIIRKLNTV